MEESDEEVKMMEEDDVRNDVNQGEGEGEMGQREEETHFHLGRAHRHRRRNRIRFIRHVSSPPPISFSGSIGATGSDHYLQSFVITPTTTLTEWTQRLEELEQKIPTSTFLSAMYSPAVIQSLKDRFYARQRERWLARWTLQRWTQRVWKKRTQCNIDLIDMEPVADKDAIFITDTKHRYIFRFHRRDLFQNLISNLYHCEDMMPYPRPPSNPWTNAPLTLGQIIHLCQCLILDFAKRGKCPPVLFSAFCESRYDMEQFRKDHPSLLAQYAIRDYFKDLTDDNRETVEDTMTQLLDNSLSYVFNRHVALREWLKQSPITPMHREWLQLLCDYTLYTNLHLQVRSNWHSIHYIYQDVRLLYSRTELPEVVTPRLRLLRGAGTITTPPAVQTMMSSFLSNHSILPSASVSSSLTGQFFTPQHPLLTVRDPSLLRSILFPNTTVGDEELDENSRETLRLIQNTLFRR